MGAGRKKQTLTASEKVPSSWKPNFSASARNLRKSDLGGVIFGCKHNTFRECYFKQLFGLPAPHFSYVRNIDPGLPLFLFNYSDRKLHGVFEAASQGKMNLNPYAWTADESESTAYPAQVKVKIRMQCEPLVEEQFAPLISENYYEKRLFWFELDRNQTKKLISLFSSLPKAVSTATAISKNTEKWSTMFNTSSLPKGRREGDNRERSPTDFAHLDLANSEVNSSSDASGLGTEYGAGHADIDDDKVGDIHERSYSAVVRNVDAFTVNKEAGETSHPQRNWSSLFKEPATSGTGMETEEIKALENLSISDQYNVEWESSPFAHCSDEDIIFSERQLAPYCSATDDSEQGGKEVARVASESNLPYLGGRDIGSSSTCLSPPLDKESDSWEAAINENAMNIMDEEGAHIKSNSKCASFSPLTKEIISVSNNWEEDGKARRISDGICSPQAATLEVKSSDVQSTLVKLLEEVKELRSSHQNQVQKISSLEQNLVESRLTIQNLLERCKRLEALSFQHIGISLQDEYHSTNDSRPNSEVSVLIVGGFDGSSWLSATDCYYPSQDHMESRCPMSLARSYASTAKLNNEIYIFGGSNDKLWYDTVELYNPSRNQWTSCPSLNQKKGSLAGVSLNDKIFAIGGGNGVESLSEVEMFDLDIERWIPCRSMLHKRFAPAAAEINGAIYVVGGFDGKEYLRSAERFDPREFSWTKLESMNTKRACHSLVVLNEKLFAVGGYDGAKMVPAVEVFEPRRGSWMMSDSMNIARGYSGAVVIENAIYAIGGLKDGEILDTVECYKEGVGWKLTTLKGVGKRSFFSSIVL
ncbi:hypothetical protein UlMin_025433 [Ulmus minor]